MVECKPLQLTNMIADKYPDCWNTLERIRDFEDNKYDRNICYVPLGGCMSITLEANHNVWKGMMDAQLMVATASWRQHKQIFQFSSEIEEMLIQQTMDEDMIIPISILKNLPYQCLYIKLHHEEYDGFFVHFDINENKLELRLLIITKENTWIPIIVELKENYTLKDSIDLMLNDIKTDKKLDESSETKSMKKQIPERKEYIEMVKPLLQLILYLCAENKEVEENLKQKTITRKPQNKQFIKDKYREVQIWDCGNKTGEIIRNYNKSVVNNKYINSNNHDNNSTPKRPHSRRGHWHHYWIGKMNSDERKLVLRWVAPTFIHGSTVGEEVVQINNIAKK